MSTGRPADHARDGDAARRAARIGAPGYADAFPVAQRVWRGTSP
jgi:hypothetical protein